MQTWNDDKADEGNRKNIAIVMVYHKNEALVYSKLINFHPVSIRNCLLWKMSVRNLLISGAATLGTLGLLYLAFRKKNAAHNKIEASPSKSNSFENESKSSQDSASNEKVNSTLNYNIMF